MEQNTAKTEYPKVVDDALLARIAAGDREAFHFLYQAIAQNIYGFSLSITKNPHDAEDVVQETLLAVYRHAHTYRGQGKPMAWIFTIARNFSLKHLQLSRRVDSLDGLQDLEGDGLSRISAVEQRMVLQAVLRTLSEQEQQIVMLHAVHGMKNREISEILHIPLNTVLSKYHRALKKLRKQMEGAHYDE